jgi:hypothetical protein
VPAAVPAQRHPGVVGGQFLGSHQAGLRHPARRAQAIRSFPACPDVTGRPRPGRATPPAVARRAAAPSAGPPP